MDELMENVKKIAREAINGMHGWCSDEKSNKIVELIVQNKPDLCVEIGVFAGKSLIPQALAVKHNDKGVVYGIDPWRNDSALEEMIHEDHKKWWSNLNLEDIYNYCKNHISKNELEKYCFLLRDKSENVVNQFQDESIDILHIDGNHSEALSYKDATLYFPKIKVGGYILFDDIWWTEKDNYVTTRKAISYLKQNCINVEVINNDCLLMRKISNE